MPDPGYTIGRDSEGFTEIERQVRDLLNYGFNQKETADLLGRNKQRVWAVRNQLRAKGVEVK
jgi:hypothetical protein